MRSSVLTLRGRAKRADDRAPIRPHSNTPLSNSACKRAVRELQGKTAPFTVAHSPPSSLDLMLLSQGLQAMTFTGTSTKFQEPRTAKVPVKNGSIEGRWTWWFSAIADLMIRHPDKKLKDIAAMLNKHPSYLSIVTNTDMFREYLAQRKEAWRQEHDHALRAKLTDVATHGLDIVLEHIQTKRAQIPLNAALKITESALDRLGYAPDAAPAVVVNNTQDNRQQTVNIAGLSTSDLEEARSALRRSEQVKIGTSFAPELAEPALEQGVGLDVSDVTDVPVEELPDAPST
jgi:hypothetical protein